MTLLIPQHRADTAQQLVAVGEVPNEAQHHDHRANYNYKRHGAREEPHHERARSSQGSERDHKQHDTEDEPRHDASTLFLAALAPSAAANIASMAWRSTA